MVYELLYGDKTNGQTWNIGNLTETVSYDTQRTGSPGKLTFACHKVKDIFHAPGDVVRFSVDGTLIFFGWVFTVSTDRWGVIEITCYDQLRYLKANASYAFYGVSAGEIIAQIAGDFGLTLSTIEDTGYKLPSLIETDKSCLDIISEAIQQTLLNTGKMYVFFDDGIGLSLREAKGMISDTVLGEKSLVGEFDYKIEIDSQTYNSIKLSRPNEETGKAEVFLAQDSTNIGKWGLLQYYSELDENVNDAQAAEQAKSMLSYYNKELKKADLSSLGVVGLRAGQMVLLMIPGNNGIQEQQYVMLESVSHTFTQGHHTMDIQTLSIL